MSESEGDYQLNGRPVSTFALSFAASLDSAFQLSPELDTLSKSIASKRRSVNFQQSELEKLQARIRETEERLKDRQAKGETAIPPGRNQTAKKPTLETISSPESEDEDEDESDPSGSDTSEEVLEKEEEPEVKPSQTPARQRSSTQSSQMHSRTNPQSQSTPKRTAVRQVDRKSLASRGKA